MNMHKALKSIKHATSSDASRPTLAHIQVWPNRAYATDGHRLSIVESDEFKASPANGMPAYVDGQKFPRKLEGLEWKTDVRNFPNVQTLIDGLSHKAEATVDREEVLAHLRYCATRLEFRRAAKLARAKADLADIHERHGSKHPIGLAAKDCKNLEEQIEKTREAYLTVEISLRIEGLAIRPHNATLGFAEEEFEKFAASVPVYKTVESVGVQVAYLVEALETMTEERVTFRMTGPLDAIQVTCSNRTEVIMPVRI